MTNTTKLKNSFRTRVFRNGGYSMLLIGAVIVVTILLNVLISRLPSSIVKPSISPFNYYDLTKTTTRLVEGIKDDISIYLVASIGKEDPIVEEFIKRYCELNSHLKLKYVDPTASPGFVETYSPDGLDENSIIVINEDTKIARAIPYAKIFGITFSSQEEYYYYLQGYNVGQTYFDGENALTSALDYVTMEHHPVIYLVSGHGESQLGSTLLAGLENDNYTVKTLPLLTATEIPSDASVLIINRPAKDLTESEISLLRTYMEKGGKLLLSTAYTSKDLPLLYGLSAEYGMTFKEGVIMEGNVNHYYSAPYFILPNIASTTISAKLTSSNISIFAPLAHPIDISSEIDTVKFKRTVLMSTSSAAFLKFPQENGSVSSEKADGDETGTFTVACMTTNVRDGAFVWFSSLYFMDDEFYSFNSEYIMATFSVLTGKDSSVNIASKSTVSEMLLVTAGAQSFWAVTLIGVIPAGCLLYGLYVWNKRRKQ